MNRQSKRMMQRQGARDGEGTAALEAEGEADLAGVAGTATRTRGRRSTGAQAPGGTPRLTPARFFREVRNELRQVVWPTRSELVNYTAVVLTVLVIMIALIFVLNLAFGKAVLYLFQK